MPFPENKRMMNAVPAPKKRVLAMDDDAAVRSLFTVALTHFGYDVMVASQGSEAVDIFVRERENGRPFDAVILDLTVRGGMGGCETLDKLKEIDPKVKAVVSSGLDANPVEYVGKGFRAALAKPYRVDDLRKTLNEVIAAS